MIKIPEELVTQINISDLEGRLLKMPSEDDKNILIVYGLHSSLERMYSTAQFHNRYGNVWMPDLPGFGGMDSFYKIDHEPDLDSYADYLYTFMRAYKLDKKKMRIVAMSFGFLAVTRMLQKHPEIRDNVEFVVSFVGFGKSSDFSTKALDSPLSSLLFKFGRSKTGSMLIKYLVFNEFSLRAMFTVFRLFNPKYKLDDEEQRREGTEMELDLWTKNDARTKFYTYWVLSDFDLTEGQKTIDLKLYDITTPNDQYFNDKAVSKSLQRLYKNSSIHKSGMKLHAPSVIGDEEAVSSIYPDSIKKILAH